VAPSAGGQTGSAPSEVRSPYVCARSFDLERPVSKAAGRRGLERVGERSALRARSLDQLDPQTVRGTQHDRAHRRLGQLDALDDLVHAERADVPVLGLVEIGDREPDVMMQCGAGHAPPPFKGQSLLS
jgi:hypothetical protein